MNRKRFLGPRRWIDIGDGFICRACIMDGVEAIFFVGNDEGRWERYGAVNVGMRECEGNMAICSEIMHGYEGLLTCRYVYR